MDSKEQAKRLIKIIRDSDCIYEPQYIQKCAEELSTMTDIYPEAYYQLVSYYEEHLDCCEQADLFCKKGVDSGDQFCIALKAVWDFYNEPTDDKFHKVENFKDKSIFYVYQTMAEYYSEDANKKVKYLCLAYDAERPYRTYDEIRDLQLVKLYIDNQKFVRKHASKRLLTALQVVESFTNGKLPKSDISDNIIFDAYILSNDKNILRFLMEERKYIPAFEEAYNVHWENWRTENNKRILDNAIELGLEQFIPYRASDVELKVMAAQGNIFAINEIASCYENGLCGEYSLEIAYKYAMLMANSGLESFHWSITATLKSLYKSGKKDVYDNNYLKKTYGRYFD